MDSFDNALVAILFLILLPLAFGVFCQWPTASVFQLFSFTSLILYAALLYAIGQAGDPNDWMFIIFQQGPFDDVLIILSVSVLALISAVYHHRQQVRSSQAAAHAALLFWSTLCWAWVFWMWFQRAISSRLPFPNGYAWAAILVWMIWLCDLFPLVWFQRRRPLFYLSLVSGCVAILSYSICVGFAFVPVYTTFGWEQRILTPIIAVVNAMIYLMLAFKVLLPLSSLVPARAMSDWLLDHFHQLRLACSKTRSDLWLSVSIFPFDCPSRSLGRIQRYKAHLILCYGEDEEDLIRSQFGADFHKVATRIDDYFVIYDATRLNLLEASPNYLRFELSDNHVPVIVGSQIQPDWVFSVGSELGEKSLLLASRHEHTWKPTSNKETEEDNMQSVDITGMGFRLAGMFSTHHALYHFVHQAAPPAPSSSSSSSPAAAASSSVGSLFPLVCPPTRHVLFVPPSPALFEPPALFLSVAPPVLPSASASSSSSSSTSSNGGSVASTVPQQEEEVGMGQGYVAVTSSSAASAASSSSSSSSSGAIQLEEEDEIEIITSSDAL